MIGSKVIKFNFEIQHSNWRHWHLHFTYKPSDLSHMDHNFKFLSKFWPKNWPFPAQRNKDDWLHACFEHIDVLKIICKMLLKWEPSFCLIKVTTFSISKNMNENNIDQETSLDNMHAIACLYPIWLLYMSQFKHADVHVDI